jgi:hypothetical protein
MNVIIHENLRIFKLNQIFDAITVHVGFQFGLVGKLLITFGAVLIVISQELQEKESQNQYAPPQDDGAAKLVGYAVGMTE